jgi:hypothetical protein
VAEPINNLDRPSRQRNNQAPNCYVKFSNSNNLVHQNESPVGDNWSRWLSICRSTVDGYHQPWQYISSLACFLPFFQGLPIHNILPPPPQTLLQWIRFMKLTGSANLVAGIISIHHIVIIGKLRRRTGSANLGLYN